MSSKYIKTAVINTSHMLKDITENLDLMGREMKDI